MTKLSKKTINELFYVKNNDLVRYLGSRLPKGEDARDLAQEAYLRLIRLERGDLVLNPEAYLFRIATNLVSEYWLRGQKSISQDLENIDIDSISCQLNIPESHSINQEAIEELEKILQSLPVLQQKVLLLHRRDGLTYDEIACRLGISSHMVKKHLAKGLVRCREGLRHHRNR